MTEDALLDRWRAQLGASILASVTGDRAVARAGAGWWLVLSGAPSADGNTGLVFSADEQVVRDVVAQIEHSGCPAVLLTAGDAPDHVLGTGWDDMGTMPFMAADLAATRTAYDPRVRRAVAADLDTVVRLLVESYAMQPEIASAVVEPVLVGAAPIAFWVLEETGQAVATVMTARYEDVVTVWCMATLPGHLRRGFGGALLAHVLAAARSDGATTGLLGATPAGESLYRSTGWVTVEHWRVHSNAPSVQHAH